jgi:hypothetical protein
MNKDKKIISIREIEMSPEFQIEQRRMNMLKLMWNGKEEEAEEIYDFCDE